MAEEVAEKTENTHALRNEMDHTRSSLADKLEALEDKVRSTVETTKSNVEDTVKAAKDSVQETIQTVKRTLDVKQHIRDNPWCAMGCAVFAGVLLGHATAPKKPRFERYRGNGGNGGSDEGYRHRDAGEFSPAQSWKSAAEAAERKPSFKSRILGQFEEEVTKLQSIAVGAGLGVLRDWLDKKLPSLAPHLNQVFDSATQKLGGERIASPVLRSSDDETEST